MFGKRCSLCGGKIVHGRCVDCGLDATKNDKNYTMNQSDCDDQPLTHVHMDSQDTPLYEPEETQNSKKNMKAGVTIAIVLFVFGIVADSAGSIIRYVENTVSKVMDGGAFTFDSDDFNIGDDFTYTTDGTYDYVTYELSETGNTYEAVLGAGFYKVGVHIPEGVYTMTAKSGNGGINVMDVTNGIYIYDSLSMGADYMDDTPPMEDVRLYQGAWLEITDNVMVTAKSENAQTESMQALLDNPNTEEVTIDFSEEVKTAQPGRDFEAGIYDISAVNGDGMVELYVPGCTFNDDEGEEYATRTLFFDSAGESGAKVYKNVAIPSGSRLELESIGVKLTPSENIESTDYMKMWDQVY